ncbi:unnamed protein product [Mycena citricolor]|nr:unnamed protein product [Mycena citricolor]
MNVIHLSPKKQHTRRRAHSTSSTSGSSVPRTPIDEYYDDIHTAGERLGSDFSMIKMGGSTHQPKKQRMKKLVEVSPRDLLQDSSSSDLNEALPQTNLHNLTPLPPWLASTFSKLNTNHPLRLLLPQDENQLDLNTHSVPNSTTHTSDPARVPAPAPARVPALQESFRSESARDEQQLEHPFSFSVPDELNTPDVLDQAVKIHSDLPLPEELLSLPADGHADTPAPFSTRGPQFSDLSDSNVARPDIYGRALHTIDPALETPLGLDTPLLVQDNEKHSLVSQQPWVLLPRYSTPPPRVYEHLKPTTFHNLHPSDAISTPANNQAELPTSIDIGVQEPSKEFTTPSPQLGNRFYAPRPIYYDSPAEDPQSSSDPVEPGYELEDLDFKWQPFIRKDAYSEEELSGLDDDYLYETQVEPEQDPDDDEDALEEQNADSQDVSMNDVAIDDPHANESVENETMTTTPETRRMLPTSNRGPAFAPAPGIYISPLQVSTTHLINVLANQDVGTGCHANVQ